MRIVLLGAPGSGKGTQAQKLQAKYQVPQVSSGDLLREAVARGTELGLKAKAVMDAGHLVSDDIVLGLIRDRLSRPDAVNGFILDGFPRNIEQANALAEMLEALGQPMDAVLLLDVKPESLIQRLAGRRVCPKCGTVYNVNAMAPGATGCSKDGTELQQRPDDNEEVIANRLEVYKNQTQPLVEHYSDLGLLRVVAGEGELDEVFERMESAALAKSVPANKISLSPSRTGTKRSAATKKAGSASDSTQAAAPRKSSAKAKKKVKVGVKAKSKTNAKTKTKTSVKPKSKAKKSASSKSARVAKVSKQVRKKAAKVKAKAKTKAKAKAQPKARAQKQPARKSAKPARKVASKRGKTVTKKAKLKK